MVNEFQYAIDCRALTKDYGAGHGVFDVTLQVPPGEVYGFIGANGAGKSTTMRLILDLVRPDNGTAREFGIAPTPYSTGDAELNHFTPRPSPEMLTPWG